MYVVKKNIEKIIIFVFCFLFLLLLPSQIAFCAETVQTKENFLERDLEIGVKGEDVKLLQTWLSINKAIYPEGLVTGYFGVLTERAIKKYQTFNNIVKSGNRFSTGYGRVGTITRASLNSTFTDQTYGISWHEGKSGSALFLDGGYLESPTDKGMDFENGAEITLEAWINPTHLTWRKATILNKGSHGIGWNYGFGIENQGRIFIRHNEGDIVTDKKYIKTGEWQHIAVTYSEGKDYFYYNGELVETKPDKGFREMPNNEALRIGMAFNTFSQGLDEAFLGAIDNVKIYSSRRSNDEIKSNFSQPETTETPLEGSSLVLRFDFNESKGIEAKAKGSSMTDIKAELKIGTAQNLIKKLFESTFKIDEITGAEKDAEVGETPETEEVESENVSTTTPELDIETATSTEVEIATVTGASSSGSTDTLAPSAITDLIASSTSATSIDVSWTAPGDDGNVGMATSYDVRYSTSLITAENWESAIQVTDEPTPTISGIIESTTVTELSAETIYYFAVKSSDDSSNESEISNIVNLSTIDDVAPSIITNFSATNTTISSIDLNWIAPGDDESSGTAASYDIRYLTSSITNDNWNSATQITGEPTPLAAGSTQSMTVSGLTYSTTYYFAIKTSDESSNEAELSNVVSQTTNDEGECSTSVTSGSQIYFVRTPNMPQIMRIDIDELSVSLGDTQTVEVQIRDTGGNPITTVLGTILSDNGSTNFALSLVGEDDTNGWWSGSWSPNDTLCSIYSMSITATSASGESNVNLSFR